MKQNMLLKEMPKEKEVVEDVDEKDIEEVGEEGQEEDIIRDEYYTTEGTMTDNDEIGDLVHGDYTHLLFGSCEYTHLKDISGTCLQITSYNVKLREPKSKFDLEKLFHMKALKQSISSKIDSKIKKIKKDFLTSVFEVYDRYIDRETQYDCNDIPDSGAVCETLVDAIRRHREKIKQSNRKCQPILDQSAMEITSNNLVDYSEDSKIYTKDVHMKTDSHGSDDEKKKELIDNDTISVKTEVTPHNNLAKEQHQSESDKRQQLVEIGSNRSNYSKEEDLKRKTTEIESKLPNKKKKPISPWFKSYSLSTPYNKAQLECNKASNPNIGSYPPCIKRNESSTVKDKTDILNTPQLEGSTVSNSPDVTCSPCKLKNGTPGASNDNTNNNNVSTIKPSAISSKSDLNDKRVKLNNRPPIENDTKMNEVKSSKQKVTREPVVKKESKKSKDKLNKKSSLLKKQSKSKTGKRNQLIINKSAVLRLSSSVLTKCSENKLKQKLNVQEDLPVNNEKINDFVEKSSCYTANKGINYQEEQNKCVYESSKDILKACIRDMYMSRDDITIYTDILSEADNIGKDSSIESLVKANNNMLLKKAGSSDEKRFFSKDDTLKTNIISFSVTGMQNNSGKSFHDSNIFKDEDSNKLATKINNENSNSVDIMKVEQQITTQDYSTTLVNNEREISNIHNTMVKQITDENSYSSVRGVLLKESKAEGQIIRNIESFKQYDDVKFQIQRDDIKKKWKQLSLKNYNMLKINYQLKKWKSTALKNK
ncbi:hypothetical protein K1T71_002870 [Dendrolimus kikuchii]|uniref:Uncharacterized protein n=1 Tax=Dendrolimus kikuchii TaxID=765133 RepID=A0ACC1DDX4_9NEOP|nr:hypothetical protein K1T71_002870 [Dendrolimus kikuchii]